MVDFNSLNGTTFKIVVGTLTAAVLLLMVTGAVLFAGFTPNEVQLKVLYVVATIVIAMMGLSVAQFLGKRVTDLDYQSVKRTGQMVQRPEIHDVPQLHETATFEVRPQQRGDRLKRALTQGERGE